MKTQELKVARIGNSRGVRLPASSLKRYGIGSVMIMKERTEGILLRPAGPAVEKLTWEDTAREMAAVGEDWSVWDAVDADGLEAIPWETWKGSRVGEKKSKYGIKARLGPRTGSLSEDEASALRRLITEMYGE